MNKFEEFLGNETDNVDWAITHAEWIYVAVKDTDMHWVQVSKDSAYTLNQDHSCWYQSYEMAPEAIYIHVRTDAQLAWLKAGLNN